VAMVQFTPDTKKGRPKQVVPFNQSLTAGY